MTIQNKLEKAYMFKFAEYLELPYDNEAVDDVLSDIKNESQLDKILDIPSSDHDYKLGALNANTEAKGGNTSFAARHPSLTTLVSVLAGGALGGIGGSMLVKDRGPAKGAAFLGGTAVGGLVAPIIMNRLGRWFAESDNDKVKGKSVDNKKVLKLLKAIKNTSENLDPVSEGGSELPYEWGRAESLYNLELNDKLRDRAEQALDSLYKRH